MYSFRTRRNSELFEAFKMLDADGDGKVWFDININIRIVSSMIIIKMIIRDLNNAICFFFRLA